MNGDDRTTMMRALAGELSEAEAGAFAQRLKEDAALRAEWRDLERVQGLLQAERTQSFQPFFAARVVQRVRAKQSESLIDGLLWLFRPLAPAAALVALLIAFNNWSDYAPADGAGSVLEAVFAVDPISLDAAYAMEE